MFSDTFLREEKKGEKEKKSLFLALLSHFTVKDLLNSFFPSLKAILDEVGEKREIKATFNVPFFLYESERLIIPSGKRRKNNHYNLWEERK